MRDPGAKPDFETLRDELQRAEEEWDKGNHGKAERILRVVASIAYAEAEKRGPGDPIPMSTHPSPPL